MKLLLLNIKTLCIILKLKKKQRNKEKQRFAIRKQNFDCLQTKNLWKMTMLQMTVEDI